MRDYLIARWIRKWFQPRVRMPRPKRTLLWVEPLEDRLVPFSPGDLVLLRVGDGSAALSSAATAVFLEERSPIDGSLVPIGNKPLPLPTAVSGANGRLT